MKLTEKMYIEGGNLASNVKELFELILENSNSDGIYSYQNQECTVRTEFMGFGWRSFQAIFNIVNTYFESSEKEVAYYATKYLKSLFCPDIEKIVFATNLNCFRQRHRYNNYIYYDNSDEHSVGLDGLSYKDIELMADSFKVKKESYGTVS